MADYSNVLVCPSCSKRDLNLLNYSSLMVLKPDLGLFTIQCPTCSARISTIQPIPEELAGSVALAALEVGAGMGKPSGIR